MPSAPAAVTRRRGLGEIGVVSKQKFGHAALPGSALCLASRAGPSRNRLAAISSRDGECHEIVFDPRPPPIHLPRLSPEPADDRRQDLAARANSCRWMHHPLGELRHPRELRRLPDPGRRAFRLGTVGVLLCDRDPESGLGLRAAAVRRSRREVRRSPRHRAGGGHLCGGALADIAGDHAGRAAAGGDPRRASALPAPASG